MGYDIRFICSGWCGNIKLTEMKQSNYPGDQTLVCPKCGGCRFWVLLYKDGEVVEDISKIPLKDLKITIEKEVEEAE